MSRRTPARKNQRKPRPKTEAERDEDLVKDTAGIFTCDVETANDFCDQCETRLQDLECDLAYNDLAHEIWAPESSRVGDLVAALAELAAERRRHESALADLLARFVALAADKPHVHLDPPEKYRDLVRARIFAKPSSPAAPSLALDPNRQIPTQSRGR